MNFLILSDMFSLESWLIEEKEPQIMPAVYELFQYLGNSKEHRFHAIIINPKTNKLISFPNGSSIELKKSIVPFHYVRKFISLFQIERYGQKWLKNNTADLIYGMSIYSISARRLGKRNKLFSVSRLFGSLIFDVMKKKQWWKLYSRYILQYFEAKRAADLIICTEDGTEFDRAINRINTKANLYTLFNGINSRLKTELLAIKPVTSLPEKDKISILYSGRLTQWKRQDLGIEVLESLINNHGRENVELTILGKGEMEKSLKLRIQQKNLGSVVKITPPVSHAEIPKMLERHQIFLSMYDASNLSNSMWEAALAGRIICTRNTGKTLDIFKEGIDVIASDDPKFLASKINQLIGVKGLTYGQKARDKVDKLIPTWKERFRKEMSIIAENITKVPGQISNNN